MLTDELQAIIRSYRNSSVLQNGTIVDMHTENSGDIKAIYGLLQGKYADIGSIGAVKQKVNRCLTAFKSKRRYLLARPVPVTDFLAEVFQLPTATTDPAPPTPHCSSPAASTPTHPRHPFRPDLAALASPVLPTPPSHRSARRCLQVINFSDVFLL